MMPVIAHQTQLPGLCLQSCPGIKQQWLPVSWRFALGTVWMPSSVSLGALLFQPFPVNSSALGFQHHLSCSAGCFGLCSSAWDVALGAAFRA